MEHAALYRYSEVSQQIVKKIENGREKRGGCVHRRCCSLEHPTVSQYKECWASPRTFPLTNSTVSLKPNLRKTSSYWLPSGDISWIRGRYPCLPASPAKPPVSELAEWKSLAQV